MSSDHQPVLDHSECHRHAGNGGHQKLGRPAVVAEDGPCHERRHDGHHDNNEPARDQDDPPRCAAKDGERRAKLDI